MANDRSSLVDRRIHSVLRAADLRSAGVGLAELVALLPDHGPASAQDLAAWLGARSDRTVIRDGRAYLSRDSSARGDGEEYAARTAAYLSAARALIAQTLHPVRSAMLSVQVTGSTAYGTPAPDDDCDLFAVVRRGSLWWFLAFTFAAIRLPRGRPPGGPRVWCLNYVLEEDEAVSQFSVPRGFLFAREALSAIPLQGEESFRRLLSGASWLRVEAPRLCDRWGLEREPPPASTPASWGVRVLNAAAFPLLASYLQVVGLYRNWRLRRQGRSHDIFRTVTTWGRYEVQSTKFSELAGVYAGSSVLGEGCEAISAE